MIQVLAVIAAVVGVVIMVAGIQAEAFNPGSAPRQRLVIGLAAAACWLFAGASLLATA